MGQVSNAARTQVPQSASAGGRKEEVRGITDRYARTA